MCGILKTEPYIKNHWIGCEGHLYINNFSKQKRKSGDMFKSWIQICKKNVFPNGAKAM